MSTAATNPLTVSCTYCGEPAGNLCIANTGAIAEPHAARVRAVAAQHRRRADPGAPAMAAELADRMTDAMLDAR